MVFVMVEMSAFPCLCRWISNCINLCFCPFLVCSSACVCVFGSLSPSLYLCNIRICFCVLIGFRSCVSVFSSHPTSHVCMPSCLCVSTSLSCVILAKTRLRLWSWSTSRPRLGSWPMSPGYLCVPVSLCLNLYLFILYVVMSQWLHISHCVLVPWVTSFCPASIFMTETAPQTGYRNSVREHLYLWVYVTLASCPIFVCLHAPMSILYFEILVFPYVSISTHSHLCPHCCFCVWSCDFLGCE